jgi:hypothetical protein
MDGQVDRPLLRRGRGKYGPSGWQAGVFLLRGFGTVMASMSLLSSQGAYPLQVRVRPENLSALYAPRLHEPIQRRNVRIVDSAQLVREEGRIPFRPWLGWHARHHRVPASPTLAIGTRFEECSRDYLRDPGGRLGRVP